MHNINMPQCLNCAEELSNQPAGLSLQEDRGVEREGKTHYKLQGLDSILASWGDTFTFIWHRGPGLCDPDASLASAITAQRADLGDAGEKRNWRQVGLLGRRGRWIGQWYFTHSSEGAGLRGWGWGKRCTEEGRWGEMGYIAWNRHVAFFTEKGQSFTAIVAAVIVNREAMAAEGKPSS